MNKKIAILFLFVVSFFLMVDKTEAGYDGICGTADGHIFNRSDSSFGSYSPCSQGIASGLSFPAPGKTVSWQCLGGGTPTAGKLDSCSASRRVCSVSADCGINTNCITYNCITLGLGECTSTTKSNGTSCGTEKFCYSGNCTNMVGLGESCSANYFCKDNGTYCGPANKCVCTPGLVNCADDSDTCICNFYAGWYCKDSYDTTEGWKELCEPPSYNEPEAPSVDFFVDKTSIDLGEFIKLSYRIGNDAKECIASADPQTTADPMSYWLGPKPFSNGVLYSSSPITPNNTGTMKYIISCSNEIGTNTKSINVAVNPVTPPPPPPPPSCIPCSNENEHCKGNYADECGTGATCTGTKDCTWREVTP